LADGQQTVQGDQYVVFVLLVSAVHVKLPNTIDGEFLFLELDLVRAWCELVSEHSHMIGESGREEDNLDVMCAWKHAGVKS
jgi:hypothetical protein